MLKPVLSPVLNLALALGLVLSSVPTPNPLALTHLAERVGQPASDQGKQAALIPSPGGSRLSCSSANLLFNAVQLARQFGFLSFKLGTVLG